MLLSIERRRLPGLRIEVMRVYMVAVVRDSAGFAACLTTAFVLTLTRSRWMFRQLCLFKQFGVVLGCERFHFLNECGLLFLA